MHRGRVRTLRLFLKELNRGQGIGFVVIGTIVIDTQKLTALMTPLVYGIVALTNLIIDMAKDSQQ